MSVISPRTRVDSYAAGMSPLLAVIPWKIAEACGASEDGALSVAWYSLLVLTGVAIALRATAWGKKSYFMAVYRESFEVAKYLRELAFWCAFYAIGTAALSIFLQAAR